MDLVRLSLQGVLVQLGWMESALSERSCLLLLSRPMMLLDIYAVEGIIIVAVSMREDVDTKTFYAKEPNDEIPPPKEWSGVVASLSGPLSLLEVLDVASPFKFSLLCCYCC